MAWSTKEVTDFSKQEACSIALRSRECFKDQRACQRTGTGTLCSVLWYTNTQRGVPCLLCNVLPTHEDRYPVFCVVVCQHKKSAAFVVGNFFLRRLLVLPQSKDNLLCAIPLSISLQFFTRNRYSQFFNPCSSKFCAIMTVWPLHCDDGTSLACSTH